MALRPLLWVTLAAGIAGCGVETPATAVVRDSAGVTIVENAGPSTAVYQTVDSIPLLKIGGSGAAEDEFSRIGSVRWLSDGGVAVADLGTQDIRLFGPDGIWRATLGRKGGGPGEFEGLGGLHVLADDTILAHDYRHRRISRFGPEGTLVGETTLSTDGPMFPQLVGHLTDGRTLFRAANVFRGADEPRSGLLRPAALVVLYSDDGALVDTVGEFPGSESLIQVGGEGERRSISVMSLPFGRNSQLTTVGDRLMVAPGDGYELRFYRVDGTLERLVRRSFASRPVEDADIEAYLQRLAERSRSGQEFADQMRKPLMDAPRPDAMPGHGNVLPGPDEQVWVSDFQPPGATGPVRWSVFDSEGQWLGEVEMPARFRPFEIAKDRVLGVWEDPDDVPYIRVYRLRGM